ncbi:antibiotic biosynthesis monooxygenase [Vibrio sp. SS-MA-C1-2]|uniref:putative quinol monooxygenase n=1 Tax=Vibrio sp. SS-MA-C1-2 TaxID=2908646 RepID=UPI001F359F71|nr:putative quinol monooxygenase [Vibrio sp. SS-MA-C1-2]UJF18611.1 antibiotic biosynthesis monooxygenase [Vibrio sp. SS-MA-C1-2]
MPHLTIVADIVAKDDAIELVKSELLKLVEPTLKEDGCLGYVLHQNNENPAHFTFYENWQSKEHLVTHLANSHIAQYQAATKDKTLSFTINELTQIS